MKKSAKKRSRRKTGQDAGNLFPFYAVSSFIWDLRWNFWGSNLREISAVSKSRYQSPDIGVVPFDAAENASALPQRFPFIGTVHGKEIFLSFGQIRSPSASTLEFSARRGSFQYFLPVFSFWHMKISMHLLISWKISFKFPFSWMLMKLQIVMWPGSLLPSSSYKTKYRSCAVSFFPQRPEAFFLECKLNHLQQFLHYISGGLFRLGSFLRPHFLR